MRQMDSSQSFPALFSAPRITTLVSSLFVTLSSGTNYVYSAYAPQLGARLRITHTQLNIIALAGNVGVYSSGPIWGKIVDSRGPRLPLISAFFLLLSGYSGIRRMFDIGLPDDVPTLATFYFYLLVACSFMTGAGGNGGLTSSVNSTAKSFPDRARASTTGLVISGFGLSAFLFSTIAHVFYAGDTSAFLLLLALGTSIPMLMGVFLVRPIPLPPVESHKALDEGHDSNDSPYMEHGAESLSPLLEHDDLNARVSHVISNASPDSPLLQYNRDNNSVELSPSRAHSRSSSGAGRSLSRGTATSYDDDGLPNIYGRRLWESGDFWLLFSILSMLSGTGLMYINNVGSMSQALYAKGNSSYDQIEAARWQATQVSSISLLNFSGRIFIGLVSDFTKNKLGMPRSYCLVLVAFFFFISQVTAANVDDISNLWISSALLGLAHGSVFSLFPTVCIEWFGLPHFSENWGYLSMSPMLAGNVFSIIFGRNLDAHEARPKASLFPPRAEDGPLCVLGRECYVATLYITIAATFFSMLLSVWAGWRDRRRMAIHKSKFLARRIPREVIWDQDAAENGQE